VPSGNSFYEFVNRIYMQDLVTGYPCGGPGEPCDAENRPYYRPGGLVTRQQMSKFVDQARRQPGIHIDTDTVANPIYARSTYGISIGVHGESDTGRGVYGESTSGIGVSGQSSTNAGVRGSSSSSYGVFGTSTSGYGVYGFTQTGQAGHFNGNVQVTGNLSKGGGSFKIDHPLDPENKYLYHSFVESPDMMNVYNGNVTTNDKGEATVQLPEWFSALNRDFRYQLTTIGQHADAWVATKISDNRFTIATDKPNVEVSWQVTGIRHDPYANAHRIPVEEDKPADERGMYLHPTEWSQPESLGVDYEEQQKMQASARP
jgi:hypothetical protein